MIQERHPASQVAERVHQVGGAEKSQASSYKAGVIQERHPASQVAERVHQVGGAEKSQASSYKAGVIQERHPASQVAERVHQVGGAEKSQASSYKAGKMHKQSAAGTDSSNGERSTSRSHITDEGRLALKWYRDLSTPVTSMTEVLSTMSDTLSKTRGNPERRNIANWAILNKFCKDAGITCALNSTSYEGLDNAVGVMLNLYKKLATQKISESKASRIIRENLDTVLPEHGIERIDVRDMNVTINNSNIVGPEGLPLNFDSPYGFGPYVDAEIRRAAEDVGKIAQKSSLDNSIVMKLSNLPNLALSLQQIRNNPHGYRFVLPENMDNSSTIDERDGRTFLTHFNNMCTKEIGAHYIVTSKKQENVIEERGVKLMAEKYSQKIANIAENNGADSSRRSPMILDSMGSQSLSTSTVTTPEDISSTRKDLSLDTTAESFYSCASTTAENSCYDTSYQEEALDSSLVQQLSDGKREAVNRELRECAEEMKDLELYDGDTPSSSHVPSPCSGLSLQNNKGGGSHTR